MAQGLRARALVSPDSALNRLCEPEDGDYGSEFQFLHYKLGIIKPVTMW